MKKFFKRIYKRFKVKMARRMRNNMVTHEEVELHEKTAFKICVKVISHPSSDFMIAPLSDKRYIINEDLNLFIIINWNKVEITNHVFHYDVVLSKRDHERVIYLYDTETEKRRTNTEANVKANIKNSLDTLLSKINQHMENNK
jgi:hypothetical protein